MEVVCQSVSGVDLEDFYYTIGYFPATEFDLKAGEIYSVLAQCILEGGLLYLIDPEGICRPSWYPASLFTISDGRLPSLWSFAYFSRAAPGGIFAIWGYSELVNSIEHFDGLMERKKKDLDIFTKRKREIEAEAANRYLDIENC